MSDNDPKWIEHMHMKNGALHREMHVPLSKDIPKGRLDKAAKAKGTLGKRARVAEKLESLRKH